MKTLLLSKKSIIAISILCLTILIIALSMICLDKKPSQSNIQASTDVNSNPTASGDGGVSTLAYINGISSYIEYSEIDAISRIRQVVSVRGNSSKECKILSCSQSEVGYMSSTNLSQYYYNNELKKEGYINDEITGTCTLIAIIMAKNIMDLNSNLNIKYSDGGDEVMRNTAIFADLYNISISLGNNYIMEQGTIGTNYDTIAEIIKKYYADYGIKMYITNDLNPTTNKMLFITDHYYYSDVRDGLYGNIIAPSVLSIYHFWDDGSPISGAHSVVVKGAIVYDVEYRQYTTKYDVVGIKHSNKFNTYVISNGWSNSSSYDFGDNLQILIFDDDASFAHECSVKGWTNYGQ